MGTLIVRVERQAILVHVLENVLVIADGVQGISRTPIIGSVAQVIQVENIFDASQRRPSSF